MLKNAPSSRLWDLYERDPEKDEKATCNDGRKGAIFNNMKTLFYIKHFLKPTF
jgi:hypothetical protein